MQWPEDHQVRISWDRSTYSEITEADVPDLGYIERNLYYPRAKHLSDGAVLLSFSNHHYGFDIYAMRSIDGAKTWSDAVCIAHSRDTVYRDSEGRTAPDRIVYVNPDFIELQDGRIIMAFQWRFYKGYGDLPKTNENCGIMTAFSSDKGRSWSEPVEVYRGRCWEPAFLQLPSGEIQMYITSSQDIREKTSFPRTVVIRSFDGGMTWQGKSVNSFTTGSTVGGKNTFLWPSATATVSRTKTVNSVNTFSKWGSWSNWNTSSVSASGTRQVETRVVYRYRDCIVQ